MLRRVINRVGRRGGFLLFLAVLDVLYGWSLFSAPLPPRFRLFLPMPVWAWVWIGAGVVCLTGVPVKRDRVQYTVAAAVKGAWAALFFHLWLVQHLPRGWVATVIWMTFGLTVVMVGSWPEQTIIVLPAVVEDDPR